MLAHVLDRAAYGDVARELGLAFAVAQLTMAGLAPAVARAVAGAPDDEQRWSRAAAMLPLTIVAAAATALLVVPLAALGLAPWRAGGVAAATAVAAVYAVYFALKCVLFALTEVALYARFELGADALFFGILALLAMVAPRAALVVFALAYAGFVAGVARLIRRRARRRERPPLDRAFGRFAVLATLATYASVARLPLVTAVVGAVAGSRDAAGIAGVVAIVMPLFLVPQAAGMLTFAAFARAPEVDQAGQLAWMIRAVGLCSVAVVAPLVLLARPVVSLLLGASYVGVASSLAIVAIAAVPQLVATPVGNAISGEGAAGVNAALGIVALCVALVGAAVLAPRYHVVGAASALGASMLFLGCATLAVGRARYFTGARRAVGVC